jgi:hypothetical protein
MSQSVPSQAPGGKASISVAGGAVGGTVTYTSGIHFTGVTRIDADTLSIPSLPFDPVSNNFIVVSDFTSGNLFTAKYTPLTHAFSWNGTSKELTVTGAAFSVGGSWHIEVLGPDRFASAPENAQNVIVLNPSHLYGDDIVVIEQENVPVATPSITKHIDVSHYRSDKFVHVIHVGTGLVSKIFFAAEPGDITSLQYTSVSGLGNLSATGYWLVDFPCRAIKVTVDSGTATDDVYIYMSLR